MLLNNTLFKLSEKSKTWFHPSIHFLLRKIRQSLDIISLPILKQINILNFNDDEILSLLNNSKIALVWNSPNLNYSEHWEDIDSYDNVIRLNSGIISDKLDSKTTWVKTSLWWIWVINAATHPEVSKEVMDNKSKYKNILLWLSDNLSDHRNAFYKLYMLLIKFRKHRLYYMPDKLYKELIDQVSKWTWKKYIPSTWFVFFNLLYNYVWFKRLDLYGFTFSTKHRILSPSILDDHNFQKEKEIIEEIVAREGNIKIYE